MCLASMTMACNLSCSSNSMDQKKTRVYMYFFRVMANIMTLLHLEQIVADLKMIMCSTYMTEVAERAYMRMMRRMQVGYNFIIIVEALNIVIFRIYSIVFY